MINIKYGVSLSPFEGRLDSPFETSSGNDGLLVVEGCRKAESRQESVLPIQSETLDDGSKETGTIKLVKEEKEHTENIVKAYFNDEEASVMIDTCSIVSTIKFDDPTRNRIFKVGKKITCSRFCREKDALADSREKDDTETASVKRDIAHNDSDEMPQGPLSEGDETPASVINAGETWKRMLEQPDIHGDSCYSLEGNAMPSSDHSVKYNDKVDKIYKALKHTFNNGEDDMIKNIPMSSEKKATNNIEINQDMIDNDHEAIGRYERMNSVLESTFKYT